MEFKKLNNLIIDWGAEKGILKKATPLTQLGKTQEEVNELFEALVAQNNSMQNFKNSKGKEVYTDAEIKDAIGDILVTLIIQCAIQKFDIKDCLEGAYNVIKKRTGKMVNGVFVKDK